MQLHVRAALLSAFVIPGLGQLYKKERLKGALLIAGVNIFLLIALFFVMQGMGQLMLSSQGPGPAEVYGIIDNLRERFPGARWLLSCFFVLWAYATMDALLGRVKGVQEDD